MSKKLILSLIVAVFFLSYHSVLASLMINEIMYDLSGADSTNSKSREWIEIYNSETSEISIDASKWRIYDGSANRTINGEVNFSIPAGSYVIWAGDKDTFLTDHPGFSGTVYDTGISSLNNTGGTLKILDQDGNVVDAVTYASAQGGTGDGNSLQKISGSWVGANPTPGVANETVISPPPATDGSGGSVSAGGPALSGGGALVVNKVVEEQKIKTKIVAKTLGWAGLPVTFAATASGHQGEQMYYGKYFWNFGDGDSKEVLINESNPLYHTYFYPGEYTVSLDFYQNRYSDIPDASDQIVIKIVPVSITISRVGDAGDFFIELSNDTNYSADISNWALSSEVKNFVLPKNTILAPNKKIIISSKITHFTIDDKSTLKLVTPQGEIAFVYTLVAPPLLKEEEPAKIVNENIPSVKEEAPAPVSIALPESLSAAALQSNVPNPSNSHSTTVLVISMVFVGLAAYLVYFIRQKRAVPQAGNDFEILDE